MLYPHALKIASSYVGVIPIDIMSATNAERKTEEKIEHLKVSKLKSGWWEGGGNNKKFGYLNCLSPCNEI